MMSKTDMKDAIELVRARLVTLRSEVGRIDERISEIDRTIARLRAEPVSFEDYSEFVRQWIIREGSEWVAPLFGREAVGVAGGVEKLDEAVFSLPWSHFELAQGSSLTIPVKGNAPGYLHRMSVPKALFAFFPDKAHEKIMEKIEIALEGRWPDGRMPVAERRKMIAGLSGERTELHARRVELQAEVDRMVASAIG